MKLPALSVTAGILAASSSLACDALIEFATSGQTPLIEGRSASCSTSRVLGGGTSEDCFYRFEFRSEAALSNFQRLAQQLNACSARQAAVEGTTVNHPDSYDQITAVVADRLLSLSLKDKGALGETLIVLRRTLP